MIHIVNPEHVIDFAFEPIRGRPDGKDAFDGFKFLDPAFDPQVLVLGVRVENVDELEFFLFRPVYRGFVRHVVEGHDVVIPQERHDLNQTVFFDLNLILADKTEDRKKALAKLLPYQREDFVGIFKELDRKSVV